jgi:CRP/FNR family transcriptional regulator, dissimilatory nitrate respiration regulator
MIAIMSQAVIDRLSKLAHRTQELAAGDVMFRAGDPVRSLFLVVAGGLRLVRSLPHGTQLILQRAGPGTILAEASLFADRYHCEAVAADPSILRVVPRRRVEALLGDDPDFARAWTVHLAREVQNARARAEVLALKTVRQRVDAWLALNGGALPPKGGWQRIASEIGTSPEALYRELAKRR